MNFPTEISELEADLACVVGIQDAREQAIARSTAPEIESIFLSSTKRLREELERRLRVAKAERAHEVPVRDQPTKTRCLPVGRLEGKPPSGLVLPQDARPPDSEGPQDS